MEKEEQRRGFAPPLFVDIRLARSVRAKGFAGNAFAQLVGRERYRWMRTLGNRAYRDPDGMIQIADPRAAADLLAVAESCAAERQRFLFFCSCQFPRHEVHPPCHRSEVARLLAEEARQMGKPATVIEWPGERPASLEFQTGATTIKALCHGKRLIPARDLNPDPPHVFPWCSIIHLRADHGLAIAVIAEPPRVHSGEWFIPVIHVGGAGSETDELTPMSLRHRRTLGLEPVSP